MTSAAMARPLRLGYFGDGPWANRAVTRIVEDRRFEVAFITPRYARPDQGLRAWAIRLGVPFLESPDVNRPEFMEQAVQLSPDLLVSMSFDQIMRPPIIGLAPLGFINCHAGALPFYRGRNPLNWALVNGESRFGITVHYIDQGIDTGDIVVQNFSPIAPGDSYADLLSRAHELCATALLEALMKIHDGTATRTPQDLSKGSTYFSRRRSGDEWIHWTWASSRIHNLVRAITLPGPGARTIHRDETVAVVESELVEPAIPHIGSEGEVVGRDERGVVVKTGDTCLRLTRVAAVRPDDTLDVVVAPQWPVGTRLGVNVYDELIAMRQRVAELERQLKAASWASPGGSEGKD